MNINDMDPSTIPTDFSNLDRLDWIFSRQHALAQRYLEIEARNGLCQTTDVPVDINTRAGQARIKDFCWRVTEEITEAVQSIIDHPHIPQHAIEELSDALHFLVELYLLAGIKPEDFMDSTVPPLEALSEEDWAGYGHTVPADFMRLERLMLAVDKPEAFVPAVYSAVQCLGNASNCLKQRPWKQSHQIVDETEFRANAMAALLHLLAGFKYYGCSASDVFRFYWLKSEVNNFRIGSNY